MHVKHVYLQPMYTPLEHVDFDGIYFIYIDYKLNLNCFH